MKKVLALLFIGTLLASAPIESEARRRVPIDTPTLRLADKIAPKYGVPRKLLRAVICKESACGANPVARRETSKSWARRARKVTSDPKEFEALMHSYGATQLSGLYTFLEYGVRPEELWDDETNLEIAAARMAKELKSCRNSEYCAAARWNGGSKPNKKARQYALEVMKLKELV